MQAKRRNAFHLFASRSLVSGKTSCIQGLVLLCVVLLCRTWFMTALDAISFRKSRRVCRASLFSSGIRIITACKASTRKSGGIPNKAEEKSEEQVTGQRYSTLLLS